SKIRTMYFLVFERLLEDLEERREESLIRERFLSRLDQGYERGRLPAEIVRDFIAGLTDSAFLRLFKELFVPEVLE
ncbi:MAG: phosphohydrolase, partial [Desulfomonilia bacterium]